MTRMFVRHQVTDYDAWRKVYDEAGEDLRSSMGVTEGSVFRSVDDSNDLTVIHDFATLEAARAFAGAPELKEAMAAAGVIGAPEIWFTDQV